MAEAAPILTDAQRRGLLGLVAGGVGLALVAALVRPLGAGYWLALLGAVALGALLGMVLGGERGAAAEARLLQPSTPAPPPAPLTPAALPAPLREAVQAALLPLLLAELAAAAERMAPPQARAARALAAAGATAAAGPARDALARDLPRLIAALAAGSGAAEAEALAARLGGAS